MSPLTSSWATDGRFVALAGALAGTALYMYYFQCRPAAVLPQSASTPPQLSATTCVPESSETEPQSPPPAAAPPPPLPGLLDYCASSDALQPSAASCAGRGYIAARNIAQGESVLVATPEVIAPTWPCAASELSATELAVLEIDQGQGTSFCSGSETSAEATWVAGEVQALWLVAIRCALLRRSSPRVWAALLELEHHGDRRSRPAQRIVEVAARRLSHAMEGTGVEIAPAVSSALLGALLTNAFGVRSDAAAGPRIDTRAPAVAVSCAAALFNHSCASPSVHTDHRLINGALIFRAVRPMAAGEEALISYTATEEPTYVRQRHLLRSKHFVCGCALCQDPCEGERCGSFLPCRRCKAGWQRPTPKQANAGMSGGGGSFSGWRCAACGAVTSVDEMAAWDDEQRQVLASLVHVPEAGAGSPSLDKDKDDDDEGAASRLVQRRLTAFISDALTRVHPNHALLLQARLLLVAFGFRGAADASSDGKLQAAQVALALAERLLPGVPDAQKADLLFQVGVAHYGRVHHARSVAMQAAAAYQAPRDHGGGQPQHRAAAVQAAQVAAEASQATATAMLASARIWAAVCSEGEAAAPCVAAKQFADLCLQQMAAASKK